MIGLLLFVTRFFWVYHNSIMTFPSLLYIMCIHFRMDIKFEIMNIMFADQWIREYTLANVKG